MLRDISILLLIALFAPGLDAQISKETKRKQIEAQIQHMRKLMQEGHLLRSHVRVMVRLKNGNRIRGVVKDGRLIEKVDGLHFVAAEAKASGAGIRVWYYDETNSYIFLKFDEIANYKVRERLTTAQIKSIERKIAEDQRRQEELRRLAAKKAEEQAAKAGASGEGGGEAANGSGANKPGTGAKEPDTKKKDLSPADQRLMELLVEFPKNEGWGAARRQEIELRKVTVGSYPDAKSKRFLDVFSDWQRAVDKFGDDKTAQPPPGPGSGKR